MLVIDRLKIELLELASVESDKRNLLIRRVASANKRKIKVDDLLSNEPYLAAKM